MKKTIALLLVFAFIFAFAACGKKEEAKETVTVTFDTDGGETIEAKTIEKGSAVVKPSTPKKSGYIFDKWTLNGSEYEFGTAVNEDITLKALWVDPNSGSGSGSGSGGNGGSGGSEDSGKKDEEIKVESLKWENNWYWVQEKCEGDPAFSVSPASLKDKITFTSSDTSIATVNEKGIVYGVKPGKVTITMKCGDKTADLPLEVREAPKPGISLDTDTVTLDYTYSGAGYPEYYSFKVSFNNGASSSSKVTWTSSDPKVASISGDGVVTATDLGHTVITATTEEGYKATADVHVVGSVIRLYYKGSLVQSGIKFEKFYTYEVTVVEESYYSNGYAGSMNVANQVDEIAADKVYYNPYDSEKGSIYFDSSNIPDGGEYFIIQFFDKLNNIYSDKISIQVL